MFILGSKSKRNLRGVHPDLIKVVKTAITKTKVDFTVAEGVRSVARQKQLVAKGLSQTMNSRHITGHAVDLYAWDDGRVHFEPFDLYFDIAEAMREAAIEHQVEVLWGAAWLKALNYYPSARVALEDYKAVRRSQGRRPFLDGVHFQLSWRQYPK